MRENAVAVQFRVVAASTPALSSPGTAITTLLLVPLLEVGLLLTMSAGISGGVSVQLAYASTLVAFGSAVLGGVVGGVIRARNLGVLAAVMQRGLWQPRFWLAQVAVPAAGGFATLMACSVAILLLDPDHSLPAFALALMCGAAATMSAAIVGIACATLTLGTNDPYLLANFVNWPILLLTGIILPIGSYPPALEAVGRLLPFTALVEVVRSGSVGGLPVALSCEGLVAVAWAAAAVLVSRTIMRRWRSGNIRELLW